MKKDPLSYQLLHPSEVKHIPTKRIFDIAFSICALVFLFPFLLLIALAIAVTSPGKVTYGHTRIGRGGKPFKCYKFRTMYSDAEKRLQEILTSDPEKKAEWLSNFKLKDDPRVTPLGRFLRRTSLDELPQFWNVLRGHLSVVGPRPVVAEELNQFFGEKAKTVLKIRPGVTGPWQVSGRSDTSYETRILMDTQYVDSQSLWVDLRLIGKTIYCMLSRKGAY
ncbi:MAG: sugar transferase [Parachlamydiales bacterium]|jgi:undecaprenyl-phosphate galactose phosphotransferase